MAVTDTPLTGACASGGAATNAHDRTATNAHDNTARYRAAVICASDRCFQGVRKDESIPIIAEMLSGQGYEITASAVLPDEYEALRAAMMSIADENSADLIITTGGTGLAPRDVTPEATAAVIDRTVPGIPEAMRAESMKITPHGMLSRGIAGIRKRTLIINLPGSPKAVKENLSCILPALDHALLMLTGGTQDCAASRGR
ncbi:molybdenum cofactor synthesis domain protein [Treponema vincentii ATCC 35580]|uniref:Molybdopterin adenylyltransferase n=1 Tax=Treponema vincentii ATCC 35580 TaxID=596324 RepID=C8PN16_9SPIR|nr:MogA/MoaB family molybdenum cofactor biosynthesis protein [Treponema vincentii]EEV21159.1 molybdenum cofactor synthesis domain protein [Treponema vincentii ATCC 35580]